MKKSYDSDFVSKDMYRTVASTFMCEDKNIILDEFTSELKRIAADLVLSTPSHAADTRVMLSVRGVVRVELIKLIDPETGIDKENMESIDQYIVRKLVDETTTLQKVMASAIKCANKTAQHLQDHGGKLEELNDLLDTSPDIPLSIRALIRSRRGPQRELDLENDIVVLGGDFKISTCFPSSISYEFLGCRVLTKSRPSRYKLTYSSIISSSEISSLLSDSRGKADIVVAPDSLEELLMDFAYSCDTHINIMVCPVRDISTNSDILLLTKITNPEEIASATKQTLEEIITEFERRKAFRKESIGT